MCRKLCFLISFVLLLTLASTTYSSDLLGDFERDLDGWEPESGTVTLDMMESSANVATLHDYSLRVDPPGGFHWAIRIPIQNEPLLRSIVLANNRVAFDVTWVASEWEGSTWAKIDKIAFNGEGVGWKEITNPVSGERGWEAPPVDMTTRLVWDYSSIDFSSLPEEPTYFYLTIPVNSDVAEPGGPFYFDNIVFFDSAFANNPEPPNTQTDVPIDANLAWTAGDDATEHDIYLGTSFEEVNEAKNTDPMGPTEVYRANQAVGNEVYTIPETLDIGTTYYWRIDEDGVKGEVWSFTTQCKAKEPSPANEATGVERESLALSWRPGFPGALHDVYFGTSFEDVNDANNNDPMGPTEVYRAHQIAEANSYTIPETLDIGKTYYWRIDENGFKGEVWSFTTFNAIAVDPSPADDANDVRRQPTLSWTPGIYADTHDVYFGTDFNGVNDVNIASLPSYPNVNFNNVDVNYYEPGILESKTTYYWRVDEVNDAHTDRLWKGSVWSFTTGNYFVVDDMESYNDLLPDDPSSNRINYTWKDGFGHGTAEYPPIVCGNGTGSLIGYESEPLAETTIVHGGGQSMPYYYVNDGSGVNNCGQSINVYYSEAERTFDEPQDWTESGVRALTLWFYGDPNNDANATEQMYVKVNGAKVSYDGDMNDIREPMWHEWNIDLAEFGIDLNDVNSIAIGFGDEDNTTTQGGSGLVYFDDIRLYLPICRPELVVGDFDGDCFIGYTDLDRVVSEWLDADETIEFDPSEMKEPKAPVLWYKFDETEGATVTDHAGNHDGTVMNLGDDTWDTSSGRDGNGCINLAAGSQTFVDVPPVALNFVSATQKITFAAWINGDRDNPQTGEWGALFEVRAAGGDPPEEGTEVVEVHCPTPLSPEYEEGPRAEWRVVGSTFCQGPTTKVSDFAGRWNHYVFTKDADADIMSIYHNGQLLVEVVDVNSAADPMFETPVGMFYVGTRNIYWGYYIGKIDDFQVYDYVLSPEEVAYLATDGTGSLYIPLETPTNLYDIAPHIINFKDFAILAEDWLEEKLWPPEP